jgi:FSR family fosmidomycin resistance protein-like MFS transporter
VNWPLNKKRRLTLATCCGAHGLQDGLSAAIYVLLPVLAQAFGLSYSQVGVIRAANNTAMGLFEIPSGMLSERLGERALLVFGLLCAGVGYLSLSAAHGFAVVLFSLFLAGFGAAFQHALSSSVISRTFESRGRRAALGIYNSSGDVGKLVFTGCFSLAIGMGAAWQGVAGVFGLMALIAAVVVFFLLRHLDAGSRPSAAENPGHTPGEIGWGIRNSTGFTALAIIVFLDIGVQSGFLTFVPFLMIEKEVPAGFAAFAVVLTLAGGILGKFSCGFLAERIGVIRSLVAVECLTAAGVVAVLLAPTLVAFLLLPVIGLVLQGSSSITYGSVGDLVQGDRQSRGFAAIYSIASGSAIVAPVGLGLIGDRYGLSPAMLTMACVVLLPLPLCALLRPALAGEHA